MKSTIFKSIIGFLLLFVSPFIVLTIVGSLYVIIQVIGGTSFTTGVQSFINIIYSLVPFFSYLTTIPLILLLVMIIIKNKQKIVKLLQKQ